MIVLILLRVFFLPTNYQQFFIKNNKIKGFSGFFKFIFLNPKRFSLVHEFNNLIFLSGRGVTPIPIALGLRVGFLYITEVLIVSRFVNCITVDEYIKNSPEDCLKVLDLVSGLFLFSWSMRFTHLDPHPNNIIFNGGKLLFVDLEGVKLNSDNLELHFGFLFGRFFSYWFNRYIDEEKYDDYVIRILNDQIPSLDLPVYLHYYTEFKSKHFSRTEHENMFDLTCLVR